MRKAEQRMLVGRFNLSGREQVRVYVVETPERRFVDVRVYTRILAGADAYSRTAKGVEIEQFEFADIPSRPIESDSPDARSVRGL